MPYLDKAETWLEKSSQLLEARPSTTRITTKYTLLKPSSSAPRKSKSSSKATTTDDSFAPTAASLPDPVRATLVLKTFDPVSGATLKYTTNKAAEVSRLIQILGKLCRPMAGLPDEAKEDVAMVETPIEGASGVATPVVEVSALAAGGKQPGQGGGGPKKGKKKGKK